MAYTVTKNSDGDLSWGNLRAELVTLTPSVADYVAGGYLLQGIGGAVNGNVGLDKVLFAFPVGGQGGVSPIWNPSTSKMQMFVGGADAAAPLQLGPLSANSTLSAVVSKVGTITVANSLKAGQFVYLQSFTQLGALNGTIVRVASATATQFTFNLGSASNVTSGADTTGTFQVVQAGGSNGILLGNTATITNSLSTATLLTMNSTLNPPVGSFVYIDNLVNGATANGVIVQVATTSSTQFTANWNGTGLTFTTAADTGNVWQLVAPGNSPITTTNWANITNSAATASAAGTAGVVTLTGVNSFNPGNIVVIQGLTNGSKLNGTISSIIASGLTNAIFKLNEQIALISTAADSGIAAVMAVGESTNGISTAGAELSTGADLSSYAFQIMCVGL